MGGVVSALGSVAGGLIGGPAGAAIGGALGNAVGGFLGGNEQSNATQQAANTAAAASNYAADVQRQMFERQVQLQEPWRKAGEQALNKLIPLTDYRNFSMSDFKADPGYGFRLSEGMKALERSAAARGGLLSGAMLKGIQGYGQDMASQEYMNAFNRYQTERNARLQPLQSLAGVGQTSANTLGNAASAYGSNIGNLSMTNAANQGNALLTQGNIRASQYGNLASLGSALGGVNWNSLGGSSGGNPNLSALYNMPVSGSSAVPTDLSGTGYI